MKHDKSSTPWAIYSNKTLPIEQSRNSLPMKNTTTIKFPAGLIPLLLSVFFLLYGCGIHYAPLPKSKPAPASRPASTFPPPAEPKSIPQKKEPAASFIPQTGPAASLYNEARKALAQGQYSRAELALERALRIEPSNGYYWYTMGELKYRQNATSEAIHFCLKSKSLAGKDKQLIRLNDELIKLAK